MELPVEGLSDSTGDAGEGVAVSSKGYRLADGIDIVFGVQEADDSLWHSALATLFPFIDGMPVIPGLVQVVAVFLFYIIADFLL